MSKYSRGTVCTKKSLHSRWKISEKVEWFIHYSPLTLLIFEVIIMKLSQLTLDNGTLLLLSIKPQYQLHPRGSLRALKCYHFHFVAHIPSSSYGKGKFLLLRFIQNELTIKIYPLHDPEVLKRMEPEWYGSIIGSQVIDSVRDYFGKLSARSKVNNNN